VRRTFVAVAVVALISLGLAGSAQMVHLIRLGEYDGLAPVCRVETARPTIALTFDDGPDPRYTTAVARLLEANDMRATFFVVGERAMAYPKEAEAVAASGNELASHSWSHARLSDLSRSEALYQVERAGDLVLALGGSALVRAPFGEITARTLDDVRSEGLIPVHWSIALDPYARDPGSSPAEAARELADDIVPGDIVLAHDADDGAIRRTDALAVLRFLLPMLRSRGFHGTTVTGLMEQGTAVAAVHRPWLWQSGFSCPDA
jgi:peptidoglycan/xylan/chitin deacetylase (PgdA/CDA1 family)